MKRQKTVNSSVNVSHAPASKRSYLRITLLAALLGMTIGITHQAKAAHPVGPDEDMYGWQFKDAAQQAADMNSAVVMLQAGNGLFDPNGGNGTNSSASGVGSNGGTGGVGGSSGSGSGGLQEAIGNQNQFIYNFSITGNDNTVTGNTATNSTDQSNSNSNQSNKSGSAQIQTLNGSLSVSGGP